MPRDNVKLQVNERTCKFFLKNIKAQKCLQRERGALMSGTMERKVKERNRNGGERPVLMLQCRIRSVCPP